MFLLKYFYYISTHLKAIKPKNQFQTIMTIIVYVDVYVLSEAKHVDNKKWKKKNVFNGRPNPYSHM